MLEGASDADKSLYGRICHLKFKHQEWPNARLFNICRREMMLGVDFDLVENENYTEVQFGDFRLCYNRDLSSVVRLPVRDEFNTLQRDELLQKLRQAESENLQLKSKAGKAPDNANVLAEKDEEIAHLTRQLKEHTRTETEYSNLQIDLTNEREEKRTLQSEIDSLKLTIYERETLIEERGAQIAIFEKSLAENSASRPTSQTEKNHFSNRSQLICAIGTCANGAEKIWRNNNLKGRPYL